MIANKLSSNSLSIYSFAFILITMVLIRSVAAAELDYHLEKTIHLQNPNQNIVNLTGFVALKNGEAAFVSSRLPDCNATIFKGDRFQQEVFSINEKDVITEPRFANQGVILNKGYFGYIKNYGRLTSFPGLNISGNVLTGRETTMFSQSKKCPTITSHSTYYNRLSSRTIGNQSECNFYQSGYLSSHNQKYILYAAKNTLYLLSYFGSTIYDEYTEIEQSQNIFSSIQSFYQSTIVQQKKYEKFTALMKLGTSNWYRVVRKNGDFKFESDNFSMYSPMDNIQITGLNAAVSFYGNYLYRWQKLSTGIQSFEWTDEDQYLTGFTLCISNDQTSIFQVQKNKLTIFSFIGGNITKTYEHGFKNLYSFIEGRVDKQNKYLIFNAFVQSNQISTTFCKMMLNDTSVICSEGFQPDSETIQINQANEEQRKRKKVGWEKFGKLSVNQKGYLKAELQDQFIKNEKQQQICLQWSLSTSYSFTQSFFGLCINTTSNLYELRSYSTQNLSLLSSDNFYIGDIPTPTAVKLVVNQYQEQNDPPIVDRNTFLLVFKVYEEWDNDEAYTIRIKQQYQNKFLRDGPPTRDLGFWNIYAYGKYIGNFKYKNNTHTINNLRIFQYLSFKTVEQIQFDDISVQGNYHFNGYRNVLMLNQNFGMKGSYVYDMKKIPGQPDFFKGIIHLPYQHSWSIIFPKSNHLYTYRDYPSTITDPLKLVFDISTLPIKEYRKMQTQQNISVNSVQALKYLRVEPLIIGRQCEIVFFITNNEWLHKYQDCVSQRKTTKYPLQNHPTPQQISYKQIYQSDSKQNIIIHSQQLHPRKSTVLEVRQIESPSKVGYKENKTSEYQKIQHINYIETIYGTSVDKVYETKIDFQPIQDVINASYYYFVKFTDINVRDTCFTILGQLQQKGGKDANIWYDFQSTNGRFLKSNVGAQNIYIPGEYAMVVKNTINCKYVATYTDKGSVLVWATNPNVQLIINTTRQEIQSIKFSGDSKIAIKTKSTLQIIDIPLNEISSSSASVKIDGVQKYALSQDGQVSAVVTDRLTVQISTTKSQQIRKFIIPSPNSKDLSIVDLSFSQDNKLLITVSNLSVYILTPAPCPEPFINQNGICQCRENQVIVENGCKCVNRFIKKDDLCVCDDREFVYQGGICGCSKNATEVEGKCQCLENFSKNGPYCTCADSFEFNSDKLTCECPYGFIDKQECISCSFPCSTCSKSVTTCDSYSATFYLLIIGFIVILIVLVGVIVFCVKRKKLKKDKNSQLLRQELDKD